jgi:predicted Zn finger-like uncharacterized protein
MTLATSCPACGTVFKIVEDQLKVSEGWVRCGHCQDVFNALEGLFDLAGRERPPLGGPAPSPRPSAGQPESRSAMRRGAHASSGVSTRGRLSADGDGRADPLGDRSDSRRGSVWDLAAARQHEQRRQAAWPGQPSDRPDAAPGASESTRSPSPQAAGMPPRAPSATVNARETEAPMPPAEPAPHRARAVEREAPAEAVDLSEADTVFLAHDVGGGHDDPFDDGLPGRSALAFDAAEVGLSHAPWRPRAEAELPGPPAADTLREEFRLATAAAAEPMPALPTFVREADRAARWRRPGMRIALGLGCLLAGTGLAAQVLLHHRDGAAARWPALRAPLEAMCEPLACGIQAPRQLDALVVESTSLTRPAGVDGYRLQLQLRNHAEFAVLAPHVELSLTDAGGAVVVRRVLSPADFRQVDTLGGGSETSWQLEMTSADKRVAGYTVAVFYP